jgi:hypothetical protein
MLVAKERKKRSPLSVEAKLIMAEKRRQTLQAKENNERTTIFNILDQYQGHGFLIPDKASTYLITNHNISEKKARLYVTEFIKDFYEKEEIDITDFKTLSFRLGEFYKLFPYK